MTNLTMMLAPHLQDPAFKARLLADPKAALAERGIQVPAGMTVEVHENTPTVFHLVLPNTRSSNELSDDELTAAAGGWSDSGGGSHACGSAVHCTPP